MGEDNGAKCYSLKIHTRKKAHLDHSPSSKDVSIFISSIQTFIGNAKNLFLFISAFQFDFQSLLSVKNCLCVLCTYIRTFVLSIPKKEKKRSSDNEDSWLQTKKIQTKCTSWGKVCKVIIDSGSCENMVSQEMVDKLKLHCDKHPHPYRIAWFKKGNEVTVNKRCLIKFSIGRTYTYKVWCDVIPMNAYHLLLGRPCQYDRKVIHDGGKNTYTFWKDGSKIILLPLKDEGKAENMLSEKEPVTEIKVTGFCYALMVQRKGGVYYYIYYYYYYYFFVG